jgi:hypothetical protein
MNAQIKIDSFENKFILKITKDEIVINDEALYKYFGLNYNPST